MKKKLKAKLIATFCGVFFCWAISFLFIVTLAIGARISNLNTVPPPEIIMPHSLAPAEADTCTGMSPKVEKNDMNGMNEKYYSELLLSMDDAATDLDEESKAKYITKKFDQDEKLHLKIKCGECSGEQHVISDIYSYYVSVNTGDDANKGTRENPFRTIQKAADVAKPGDKILIKGGLYKEFVNIKASGYVDKRITFEGEKGANGEYETIVDPSKVVGGWVPVPEIGNGVYKLRIGFDPHEITVANKRIGRINDRLMVGGSGFDILAMPSDAEVNLKGRNAPIKFWDGINVLYGYKNGVTYIRFRDRTDPNRRKIKASPAGPAIIIDNQSYITIRKIRIQNSEISLQICGKNSSSNIVESCNLRNGRKRIFIVNGPVNTSINNNTITMDYISTDCLGAGQLNEEYHLSIKRHTYYAFKYIISNKSKSDDVGIEMINPGSNTKIFNNRIFGGLIGISAYTRGVDTSTDGLEVYNNVINGMSSVGITSSEGITNAKYYNNLVYDCNINMRLHHINRSSDSGRRVYIYNNRFWNPLHTGYHFYVHSDEQEIPGKYPVYYIYNNSMSGGRMFVGVMDAVLASGGMPKTYIFNNIISVKNPNDRNFLSIIMQNKIGRFSNNWIGGRLNNESFYFLRQTNKLDKDNYEWNPDNLSDFLSCKSGRFMQDGGLDPREIFTKIEADSLPGINELYPDATINPIGAICSTND